MTDAILEQERHDGYWAFFWVVVVIIASFIIAGGALVAVMFL